MPLEFAPQRDVSATQEDAYPTRHPDRETWLERKDPVVWTDKMPPAPLTRSDMDSFERDGFLVVERVFSDDELAGVRKRVDALIADPDSAPDRDLIFIPPRPALPAHPTPAAAS